MPLDEQLGIGDGQPPACEYHLGQFAGLAPYQRSLRHFHTIFRPAGLDKISLHKSERMVDALGARLEAQRQHEIKDLFEHDGSVEVAAEITGTMVVCIDAGKVPIKGNQRVDDGCDPVLWHNHAAASISAGCGGSESECRWSRA